MPLVEMLPGHVWEWVTELSEVHGAKPPTIRECKVILDSILTTALNDRLVVLHAGQGVRTPPVPSKPRPVITVELFERLLVAVPDGPLRLMVKIDIETGLRWGELSELRVKDLDTSTGVITVQRAVVRLRSASSGARFVVKAYPKDGQVRRVRVAPHMVEKLEHHIAQTDLSANDLLCVMPTAPPAARAKPELPRACCGSGKGTISSFQPRHPELLHRRSPQVSRLPDGEARLRGQTPRGRQGPSPWRADRRDGRPHRQ